MERDRKGIDSLFQGLKIIKLLEKGFYTVNQLSDLFDINQRTIYRYLYTIKKTQLNLIKNHKDEYHLETGLFQMRKNNRYKHLSDFQKLIDKGYSRYRIAKELNLNHVYVNSLLNFFNKNGALTNFPKDFFKKNNGPKSAWEKMSEEDRKLFLEMGNNRVSVFEIIDKFNLSKSTVLTLLRNRGIRANLKSPKTINKFILYKKYFSQGLSIKEVADKMNVTFQSASSMKKKYFK